MIHVQKFGGTSIGTVERIQAACERILASRERGEQPLVVVSAMGETTDQLLEVARQVTPRPNQRELDMLLTAGERITMSLLAMSLDARGARAVSYTGSQSGIVTDERHGRARIAAIRPQRLRESLDAGFLVIVAGFQGISRSREVTTLGRGGSDTTAIALAATFAAPCTIYTDVDGVFSADPRLVPEARRLPRLASRLLSTLCHLGAQVMHARAVDLAAKYAVPFTVRSSFHDGEGTVVHHDEALESPRVRAVSVQPAVRPVRVRLRGAEARRRLEERLRDLELPLEGLSWEEESDGVRLGFWVAAGDAGRLAAAAKEAEGPDEAWEIQEEQALVSLVGEGLASDSELSHRALEVLAGVGVRPRASRGTALALCFFVEPGLAAKAAQALHRRFVESTEAARAEARRV
jgi:aspartate kinase